MAAGRTSEAAAIHRRLLPLIDALFCVTNPIPVKYALNQLGFECGPLRLPMCEPDEASRQRASWPRYAKPHRSTCRSRLVPTSVTRDHDH